MNADKPIPKREFRVTGKPLPSYLRGAYITRADGTVHSVNGIVVREGESHAEALVREHGRNCRITIDVESYGPADFYKPRSVFDGEQELPGLRVPRLVFDWVPRPWAHTWPRVASALIVFAALMLALSSCASAPTPQPVDPVMTGEDGVCFAPWTVEPYASGRAIPGPGVDGITMPICGNPREF